MELAAVNAMDEPAFIAAFGHVYEATPALALAAAARRPFASRDDLVAAFAEAADALDDDAALALLRAHPQLGERGPMAAASVAEQAGAGLGAEGDAVERIRAGNPAYLARFGFPFIVAVKGRTPAEIADLLDERLTHDGSTERAEARAQVRTIARLRIDAVLDAR